MAALDFPASPVLNDVYTANGSSWRWNGESWIGINANSSVDVQDEGITIVTDVDDMDYVGGGVTATNVAGVAQVDIPGGGTATTFFWGNGEDGSAVLDGTNTYAWCTKISPTSYRQDRSVQLLDLTVDPTVTLSANGYILYIKGTLTLDGAISVSGGAGSGASAGGAGSGAGVYGAAQSGSNGGVVNGAVISATTTGGGGRGGLGGAGTGGAAGTLGTYTAIASSVGGVACLASLNAMQTGTTAHGQVFSTGGGGSGGGGTGAASGGGGGGGGGTLGVFARFCSGAGSITANGGNGAQGVASGAGGGGGGGGGVVWFLTTTSGHSITVTAAAGVGGIANGAGAAGSNGNAGRAYSLLI